MTTTREIEDLSHDLTYVHYIMLRKGRREGERSYFMALSLEELAFALDLCLYSMTITITKNPQLIC